MDHIAIAIDGPAGAGKSTVAKIVSKALGIIYLDTGAMYRTVALKAIREGIDTRNRASLCELLKGIRIEIRYADSDQKVYLDGQDVSNDIRTPEVSIGASDVAVLPEVRTKLVELQRAIAAGDNVVMDGRDIGTYVLPDAPFKFYLIASVEERAKRRYQEQVGKGMKGITFEDILKDILYRDQNDSSREFAPLKKAEDAIEIDTTHMTIEEVAERILTEISYKNPLYHHA